MDAEDVLAHVNENAIVVVPTFGVACTGAYEHRRTARRPLDVLQRDTVSTWTSWSTARRGIPGPVLRTPTWSGTSGLPPGEVDQHVRAQIPPRALLGVGWVLSPCGERPDDLIFHVSCLGGTWRSSDQLLSAGRPDRRAVLRLHPPWA